MKPGHLLIATVLAVSPLALYAAAPASASATQTRAAPTLPQPPVPKFQQADANHDGKISRQEAQALGVPEKIFKQDDFDQSGDLNETEWMFVRLDMTDFAPEAATAPAPATGH